LTLDGYLERTSPSLNRGRPMPERSITEIGKYKIIGLIGEGAMGVVYRATDSVLDRIVAVKVMSESIARQQELRHRFLHEAQAAGSMQHPNIISVYDLGELDGHPYIVMEFVEGVDLAQIIASRNPLTLQTKLDIVIDVLAGLAYAHKRGIVHRDIKPANIRIAEDGRAKIMDFGVAHLSTSELTVTGAIVGTPAYMAPEQITGSRTTFATDLFATGAVLYELVTGVKAFSASTLQSLYFKIVTEPPVSTLALLPGLPAELNRIIEKSLAKNPSDRYVSALEMANDLTQLRATLSNAVQPATMSLTATVAHAISQKQEKKKRTTQLAAGGGLLTVAVVSAIWFATSRGDQPPIAEKPTAEVAANSPLAQPVLPPAAVTPRVETEKSDQTASPPKAQQKAPPAPPAPARAKKKEEPIARREALQKSAVVPRVTPPPPPPAARAVFPTPQPAPQPPPAPPPAPQALPQAVAPPPAAPPSPPAAPTPTAAGVRAAIQDYARAIEQRDIGAIRSVYTGLSSSEQAIWERFFRDARRINVSFQVTGVEVNGNTAQARLSGTYDYQNTEGRPQPTLRVSVNATLSHDGSAWHIVSLR
jgi:serine/threonine protein kinase